MIHRYYSNLLSNLRGYIPSDVYVSGDIVMFFLTERKFIGHQSMGMFRLCSGYATSGKTDDGVFVLESLVVSDHYWDRVCKGVINSYKSNLVLLANGANVVITHPVNAPSDRLCVIKEYTVTNYNVSYNGSSFTDSVYGKPITGEFKYYPFNPDNAVSPTNSFTLSKRLRLALVQSIPVFNDLGITEQQSYCSVEYSMGVNRISLKISDRDYPQPVMGTVEYIISGNTLTANRLNVGVGIGIDMAIEYYGDVYNYAHVYKIEANGSRVPVGSPDGLLGGYENYYAYQNGTILKDDVFVIGHAYFVDEEDFWKWSTYMPNVHSINAHTIQNNSVTDTELVTWGYETGSRTTFISHWNFAPSSTICIELDGVESLSTNDIFNYWLVHSSGAATILPISTSGLLAAGVSYYPICGRDITNPYIAFDRNVANTITIAKFSSSQNKATFVSQASTTLTEAVRISSNMYPGVIVSKFDYVRCIMGDMLTLDSSMYYIDPTTLKVYNKHSTGDSVSADYLGYVYPISDTHLLSMRYVNNIPVVGVYELIEEAVYDSTALIINMFVSATSISAVAISVNTPAGTDSRIMVSTTVDGPTYTWDPGTSHWVIHNDYFTACTIAEFIASNKNLLLTEVGSTVFVHIGMLSVSGVNTPEFISASATYSRGMDFKQTSSYLGGTQGSVIKAISDTQTEFTNNSGASKYVECAVSILS